MNFIQKILFRELSENDILQFGDLFVNKDFRSLIPKRLFEFSIYSLVFSRFDYSEIKFYGLKYRFYKIGKYEKPSELRDKDNDNWPILQKFYSANFPKRKSEKSFDIYNFLFSIPILNKYFMKKFIKPDFKK